jgi:hypothetical protein
MQKSIVGNHPRSMFILFLQKMTVNDLPPLAEGGLSDKFELLLNRSPDQSSRHSIIHAELQRETGLDQTEADRRCSTIPNAFLANKDTFFW